jgi:phage terminase Nu1 subunit (DNA packaging protein)
MNAYELADLIDSEDTLWMEGRLGDICNMLRQQADRIAELEKQQKTEPDFYSEQGYPLYTTPQIKELSADELNKAFDYYCETDEGVLRFDLELRDEWKKEQLARWKEAFKKASEK